MVTNSPDPRVDREVGHPIDTESGLLVTEHPARRFVSLLFVIIILGFGVWALRGSNRSAEDVLTPYLGESVRLWIRTDAGAAAGDLELLEDIRLLEISSTGGSPKVKIELQGHSSSNQPDESSSMWLPIDQVVEVWIGPLRVYRQEE